MSKTYDGFFSIFESGTWGGTSAYQPQALPIESESLGIQKDIRFRENLVGAGRGHQKESLVPLSMAPKGAIAYAFRADDCLKVMYSHFQCGSFMGSTGGTYHYAFYPSNGNPNFIAGVPADAPWGGTGGIYSVSLLKRLTATGTNAQWFKNGVCDKLDLTLSANDEAKLKAEYVFRSVDTATAIVSGPESDPFGSFSREPSFYSLSGTVKYNGGSLDTESILLRFNNNIEPSVRMGARDNETFKFGRFTASGEIGFDFPSDGLKYVGSMIGTGTFGLTLNLRSSGSTWVDFTLPCCVLSPFEVNVDGENYQARLPFRAFQSGTLPPVRVDVYTSYVFNGLDLVYDADIGARTLSDYEIIDAESGARTLSDYDLADRDL